ncbi:hypothetical protein CPIN18021_0277 [Campylobacter pinnipediorum subsp. caledonicus]|uniref:DUF6378 domain-containing protein n=1 Tax=Campylobacter pinnipediorum subsp. caledonicus TaxID=1874362 RepID=A0A1S6U5W6_9BACT|nr:DUF6378 domain-containing protein [Campylobacter pinnipediorum]AQW87124.1 hypothetical protein CPIN18021_0277 [Campylobacter pinnipediorum subsp. caledonicus]
MEVKEILEQREQTHGTFEEQSSISQTLKHTLGKYSYKLTPQQREAMQMIMHKQARILAGDPNVKDHWVDIAGYATLVAKELKE